MEHRGSLNAGVGPAGGHPWTLWVSLMGGVMGTFLLGFNTGVMNLLEVQVEQELAITSSEFGLAVSMYPLGGGAGALLAGRLADSFGRRSFMLMLAAPFIVGGIMPFAIQTLTELVVQRFLIGMASGAATVVTPVYLQEIAPADLSGMFGACTQLSTVVGILVGQVVCYGVDEVSGRWRTCLATVAFLALLQLALFPFMAPSPKWLLFRRRVSRTLRAHRPPPPTRPLVPRPRPRMRRHARRSSHCGRRAPRLTPSSSRWARNRLLTCAAAASHAAPGSHALPPPPPHRQESTPLVPSSSDKSGGGEQSLLTQLNDIVSHPVRRRALVASVGLQLAQQMSGINLVFFFSGALFARVGMRDRFVSTVLAGTVNVLATAGAVSIIDRVPRRTLLTMCVCAPRHRPHPSRTRAAAPQWECRHDGQLPRAHRVHEPPCQRADQRAHPPCPLRQAPRCTR